MQEQQINIYSYNNYREFLRDSFRWMKRLQYAFSLRFFARKAGFPSHSFFSAVIHGKRNLTADAAKRMGIGLELSEQQMKFFEKLVAFNQAKTTEEKDRLFNELNFLRKDTAYFRLNKNHFGYFSNWYNSVIRELCVYSDWQGDYKKLAELVVPPITESQARRAMRILLKTSLIKRTDDGKYVQTESTLSAADIPGYLIRKLRGEFIDLSKQASEHIDFSIRKMDSTTLALGKKQYEIAREILEDARQKIIALSTDDTAVDRVYQLHLHLFPVSSTLSSSDIQKDTNNVAQ